jgi:ATP-binding cassette, subfamily B, bacterial
VSRGRRTRAEDEAPEERALQEPGVPIEDAVTPAAFDGESLPDQASPPEPEDGGDQEGAWSVLRRGLRVTPALRAGIGFTIALALAVTVGRLMVPVLVQLIIDRGIREGEGFRPGFVVTVCSVAAITIVGIYVGSRATYRRLVRASESALCELRVKAFEHIHRLSIADQTAERRGTFVSRITADVETIAHFLEWGGITLVVSPALMLGAAVLMFIYSWQLTLIVLGVVAPLVLVMRAMQKGLLRAYDGWRSRVGETLTEVSETVMGAAVVRAYGLRQRTDRRLKRAIARQYRAQMSAAKYQATIFPLGDLFGAAALAAVVAVGVRMGPGWGLRPGGLIAFLFLVGIFLEPLAELSETFDHTQTAVAGWRKVLGVLDIPVDVDEPDPGRPLPPGPLSVRVEGLEFAYREGGLVLRGIDVDLVAGTRVAVVGETGCGKTTFAKLICRLADPTAGRILLEGIDLREIAPAARRGAVRMVPQDGFLFDATVAENVRYGRVGADDADVGRAFEVLGLGAWAASLPDGLNTMVGQRGENLSVGERQLVALARAQVSQPGLLVLDEATSAVDPETEQALAEALEHLSEGRTTLTIAHRLSTAEMADLVLVFDRGRIVERGVHAELASGGGTYAALYRSWLGNTGAREAPPPEAVSLKQGE